MRLIAILTFAACLAASHDVVAQSESARSEFGSALKDAQATQVVGPAAIPLVSEATLNLPAGYVFVPMPAAGRLMRAMGNASDERMVGVLFPRSHDNWMLVLQFERSGFIRDDAARDWDVDVLLQNVRDGTERGNEQRKRMGFSGVEVLGWAEKPRYDTAHHRLVWAMIARSRDASDNDQGVNYNSYVLGRDGYFKMVLVTDLKDLAAQKSQVDPLVDALVFEPGKQYSEFNDHTDRLADFGIVALIEGAQAERKTVISELGGSVARWIKIAALTLVVLVAAVAGFLLVTRERWRKRARKHGDDDFPPTEIPTVIMGPLSDASTLARPRSAPDKPPA
jgi:uncharacterized membrane-anchored protein